MLVLQLCPNSPGKSLRLHDLGMYLKEEGCFDQMKKDAST
jgi:hypothetical protein